MSSRRIYRVLIIVLALAATGCASTPGEKKSDAEYKDLYNGDLQVAHAARQKQPTAEEAIASGDQALALGDTDRAMYEYVYALELGGGDAHTLNKIGAIHSGLGNYQLAARAFTLSLRLDPENAAAHEGIGLLLLRDRRYAEAGKYLNAALEADPQRWQSHNGLGMLSDLDGEHARAATHFRQALDNLSTASSRTDRARVLNNLGYSTYMSGDPAGALPYFYQALDNHPEFDLAWQNIGLVHTMQGNYDRALNAYMHVMSKPEAYNNLGFMCMVNKKYDKAERYFRTAISLSPSYYAKAHENLERLELLR